MLGTTLASMALTAAATVGSATVTPSAPSVLTTAIIISDQAVLRAAPRDGALQQAVLRQGEMVEVRGERLDFLQVYDHHRERAGFVRASLVRRTALSPAEAPEILTVLRFVKDTPGQEAMAMGLAAAWLKAAPARDVQGEPGSEALDALGTAADRLAVRASAATQFNNSTLPTAVAAHLEVANRYGVRFTSHEQEGRIQLCYEGEAFRLMLAKPTTPDQRARAALALTRPECVNPALRPPERHTLAQAQADLLGHINTSTLPGYIKNRIALRQAHLWSTLAYQRQRAGNADATATSATTAAAAAERALAEFATVVRADLPDEDWPTYNDAAMRVNASRWAAGGMAQLASPQKATPHNTPHITTHPGQPGETCVQLVAANTTLAQRCTYSVVWPQSATLNREGTALALAVQPMPAWRELWLFRQTPEGWLITVLPPASTTPDTGYAEFAGWVPGGKQMLVAREARGEGKYQRSFAVVNLDTLINEKQAGDAAALGAFQRWQEGEWKRNSVSGRGAGGEGKSQ